MKKHYYIAAFTSLLLGTARLAGGAAIAQDTLALDEQAVAGLVAENYSEARILQPVDMDEFSCGPTEGHPGLVAGDFNGDGFEDYAVLMIVGGSEEGKQRRKRPDIVFTIFLAGSSGEFSSNEIARLEEWGEPPSITGIELRPPGQALEWAAAPPDERKVIELKHQSVLMYYCGKSAVIYYWNGGKFDAVGISD